MAIWTWESVERLDIKMKTTKRRLRKVIRESILKEYGGNAAPKSDSNWRGFADALDIGVLDLDKMAYELGFVDFRDMDMSISPGALAKRGPDLFIRAAQNSSMAAMDMSDNQILSFADMPGMM